MIKEKAYAGKELNSNEIMTATEVASFLRVSVNAVRRWSRNGKLKAYRLGGSGAWRYLKTDVLDFLHGGILSL